MANEDRQRQMTELFLLASMFPDGFHWVNPASGVFENPDALCSEFEAEISLDESYTLKITLPANYPSKSKPQLHLSCGPELSRAAQKTARVHVNDMLNEIEIGVECLDIIASRFMELSPTVGDKMEASAPSIVAPAQIAAAEASSRVKQAVIWSHHLLATSKRRSIIDWSKELHLGGYSRPGYPGAIFVEGDEKPVDEFIKRLKELRWQALQVRAYRFCETRVCSIGGGVVEVEGLGEVAQALKEKRDSAAELFLEGMKLGVSK